MIGTASESDLTFIIHFRLDNQEREKNLNITLNYLNNILPESKIIIVEDDSESRINETIGRYKNINYIFLNNKHSYKKSYSYNIGLQSALTNYVCFLDIDCIVDRQNITKCLQELEIKNKAVYIGYNGICIYFKYNVKDNIIKNKSKDLINYLNELVDRQNLRTGYECEYYTIGNTSAVGGMLIGARDTFKECGGFNPNFNGWGYEDNEIILRLNKIGIELFKINTKIPYLFHMPHTQENEQRDKHDRYFENYTEYQKILNMTKADLFNYIKTWTNYENR